MTIKRWALPRIAWKPIICYKILIPKYYGREGIIYETPYRKAEITFPMVAKSKIKIYKTLYNTRYIKEGLHSYSTIDYGTGRLMNDGLLVKTIIPRFSIYYKGDKSDRFCLASNKLKYIKPQL